MPDNKALSDARYFYPSITQEQYDSLFGSKKASEASYDPYAGVTPPAVVPGATPPPVVGAQGAGTTPFNISPAPTSGTDAFGKVPGQLGMPDPYADLMKSIPWLAQANQGVGNVLNNNLAGVLSPASQRAIQDSAAAFGVTSGMGGSNAQPGSLAFNRTLRDIGRTSEDSQRWGASAYPGIINTISNTQTVPPALQNEIASQNAINNAAPNPEAQKRFEMDQFDKYMAMLSGAAGPAGGTANTGAAAGTTPSNFITTTTIKPPAPKQIAQVPTGATAQQKAIIDAQNAEIDKANKMVADQWAKDDAKAKAKAKADADKVAAQNAAWAASKAPATMGVFDSGTGNKLGRNWWENTDPMGGINSYDVGSNAYNNVLAGRLPSQSNIAGDPAWAAYVNGITNPGQNLIPGAPVMSAPRQQPPQQPQQNLSDQYLEQLYSQPQYDPYGSGYDPYAGGGQPTPFNTQLGPIPNQGPAGNWNPFTNSYQSTPLSAYEQNLALLIGGSGGGQLTDPYGYPNGGYPTGGGYDPYIQGNPVLTDFGNGNFSPGFSNSGLPPMYAPTWP